LTVVTLPAPLPGPPLGVETRPARKPVNTTVPKGPSTKFRGRGRGRGRGAKGGGGRGRGGGVGKENSTEDATNSSSEPNVYQPGLLSPASRRRIDILNKRVYAPDGTYNGPPLGVSPSTLMACTHAQRSRPRRHLQRPRNVVGMWFLKSSFFRVNGQGRACVKQLVYIAYLTVG
jgi:hypothetical protein